MNTTKERSAMAGPRLAKKAFSAAVAIVVSTGFLSITQVPLAGPVAASATSTTFNLAGCTGAQQYAVPGDVSVVKIVAGGGGGETAHTPTGNVHGGGVGGQPGFVTATLPVTPGQTLYVGSAAGGLGGPTGLTNYSGGDGGASAYVTTDAGATCGRVSVGSVLVAAAGGGGGGGGGSTGPGGTGGAGGLPYGGDGNGGGGGGRDGGSQTAGAGGFGATDSGPGAGGAAGHSGCGSATLHATDGTSGIGMVGGDGGLECQMTARSGGGGGAGFYGGGGGGGTADNGAGGGGGGYSYAAPNAKFISYPSTGTQLSVTITPVTVSMAAHVEGGSPRATVTSVPYGTVVHLITTLSASAAGVPLNGQTRYRCPSGCRITELGLGFTEINDDGSYGDDKAINTSSLGIGLHHLMVNWSDTSGLFPNQLVGFDLNVEPPPPVVTTDPADSSVTYGGSTTFTAAASVPAGDAPTVEWQTSGDNGAHWAYVGGDDLSTTLTVTPQDDAFGTSTLAVPDFNGRLYRALFTANGLSVASTSAKLTVQPAPLTIRPVDQTYRMGTTPPALTATYDGFVTIGGVTDTSANLAGTLACTSPGTASGATYGTYTITCSGQSSSDYAISYSTGTLTVQAPLPVCQDLDVQTAQGAAVPVQLACTSAITEPLTPTIVAGPSHGSLGAVSSSGAVTYTPAAGYAGNDSFTYHVLGIGGPSLTKTVSIAVAGPPHVTITSPADGGVYERGTPLTAGYTCAPGDFGGVLASSGGCVAAVANGGTIDTSTTGVKTFTVVASDNAATPNTTTRTVTYTVHDTIPPDTAIDSGPAASSVIKQTGATFTYHGTAGDTASFECQLDGAAFAPCSSAGATYASLSDGVHTFSVRAVDASGNRDATPATRTWTVDTTPPTIAVVAPLANASYVVGQNLLANFACNDGPTGSGVASCVGTVANGGVVSTSDPGAKSFIVTASDNLGNTTSQTVTYAVTKATTSTGLTSSLHPSVSGQSVTYTATVAVVAPGSGAPTGTVAFRDAGNPMAGCSAVTVGVAGTAVCTVTYAGPGSHLISASYSGSTRYLASAGTWSQTVNKAPTVVTATNHVRTLLGFAFSATLKRGFDGAPLAGRVITFKVGGTTFCSGVTDSTGRAGCRVIGLVIGSSTYTAGFAGDAAYLPGTGTGLL